MKGGFSKGSGKITLLLLRQSIFQISIWLLCLIGITAAVAAAYPSVYKTDEDKMAFLLTMENPSMIAMLGPTIDPEKATVASMFAHEMLVFTLIAVGVMNILLISRTTRGDEEDGRLELIRSLPVGRLAYIRASGQIAIMINFLLAVLTGAALSVLNVEGITVNSAFLYGSLLGAFGLVFAGAAMLFAQLFETSRGTNVLSFAVLLGAYIIRAIGDVSDEKLSLITPYGWILKGKVFVENNWWPVLFSVGVSIVLAIIALYLNSIRDMGAGFIPERKGKKHASPFLKTPVGFAFTLERTNIFSWSIAIILLSASLGSILGDLEAYYSDMELIQAFVGDNEQSLVDQFNILLISIMSLISAVPVIMAVLKLKGEERKGRTENFYSRSVSRVRLLLSFIFVSMILSIVLQLLTASSLWFVGDQVLEGGLDFAAIMKSAAAHLPAMWVLIGMAAFLLGCFPKLTSFTWLYLAYCFIVLYLGELLDFPKWAMGLSVFHYVPEIPLENVNVLNLTLLTVFAGLLITVGMIGYRNRDIYG